MKNKVISFFDDFDGFFSDLDGVLYNGKNPVDHTAETILDIQKRKLPFVCLTNNASRSYDEIAKKLSSYNIKVDTKNIFTSSAVAADYLKSKLKKGSLVLVVGSPALHSFLKNSGFETTKTYTKEVKAVVQGFDPSFSYEDLSQACKAIQAGAFFVATNKDASLPNGSFFSVGNGGLVRSVEMACETEAYNCGKPKKGLYLLAKEQLGIKNPVFIGDRLETDILGANNADIPSILVFTGFAKPNIVFDCPKEQRPVFLFRTFKNFFEPYYVPFFKRRKGFLITEKGDVYSSKIKKGFLYIFLNGKKAPIDLHSYRLALATYWKHKDKNKKRTIQHEDYSQLYYNGSQGVDK